MISRQRLQSSQLRNSPPSLLGYNDPPGFASLLISLQTFPFTVEWSGRKQEHGRPREKAGINWMSGKEDSPKSRTETFDKKELQGRRKKKRGKRGGGGRQETARNKVPCQVGCTVSRETARRVSFNPSLEFWRSTLPHPFDQFHSTSCWLFLA